MMEDTFSFSEVFPMTTMLTDTGLTNPVDTQSTFGRVPRGLSEDEAREATAAVLDEFFAEVPSLNQRVYLNVDNYKRDMRDILSKIATSRYSVSS